jgi:hypothetical protein
MTTRREATRLIMDDSTMIFIMTQALISENDISKKASVGLVESACILIASVALEGMME